METKDIVLIFLGILTGYLVHFTASPLENRFQRWRANRAQIKAKESIEAASRRATLLNKRLTNAERFLSDQTAFIAFITTTFAWSVIGALVRTSIILVVLFVLMEVSLLITGFQSDVRTTYPLIAIMTVLATGLFFIQGFADTRIITEGMLDFERFKAETEKEISELQEVINRGNPRSEA